MKKFIQNLVLVGMAAVITVVPASKAGAAAGSETGKTIEKVFQEYDKNAIYPFPELIEEEKKTYKLEDAKFEVTSQHPVKTSTDLTMEIKSDPMEKGREYQAEKEIAYDGMKMELVSSTPTDISVKSEFEYPYTKTVTYEYANIADKKIPDTLEETVKGDDGQEQKVKLTKKSVMDGKSEWVDNPIYITYSNYNSEYYMLGSVIIPNQQQADRPALEGYETLIINTMGLDPKSYRISSISWSGGPYENDGVVYRNAVANAQVLVNGKIAFYEGTLKKEKDQKMIVYRNKYRGTKEIDTGKVIYTIKATGIYQPYDMKAGWKTAVSVLSVLLGISVFITLALLILSRKKRGKKWLQRHKTS